MFEKPHNQGKMSLGRYLATQRKLRGMTLREVEQATNKEVSNPYLSQLENDKISRPSPNILYSLASVLGVQYEVLMQKAGYIVADGSKEPGARHGRAATFAKDNLTPEEEEALLEYLAFLRSHRKTTK